MATIPARVRTTPIPLPRLYNSFNCETMKSCLLIEARYWVTLRLSTYRYIPIPTAIGTSAIQKISHNRTISVRCRFSLPFTTSSIVFFFFIHCLLRRLLNISSSKDIECSSNNIDGDSAHLLIITHETIYKYLQEVCSSIISRPL